MGGFLTFIGIIFVLAILLTFGAAADGAPTRSDWDTKK